MDYGYSNSALSADYDGNPDADYSVYPTGNVEVTPASAHYDGGGGGGGYNRGGGTEGAVAGSYSESQKGYDGGWDSTYSYDQPQHDGEYVSNENHLSQEETGESKAVSSGTGDGKVQMGDGPERTSIRQLFPSSGRKGKGVIPTVIPRSERKSTSRSRKPTR